MNEGHAQNSYLIVDKAYARATALFASKEIKPTRFRGIHSYSDSELRIDAEKAARLKKKYEESVDTSKQLGTILEAVVFEGGKTEEEKSHPWFGPKSKVIKTGPYDDFGNGVDMVVETEVADQEYSHLALGVDVTFKRELQEKFGAIRANINKGELGHVKYFISERPDTIRSDRKTMLFAGPLINIPQVVIGTEIDRVKELAFLWMNKNYKELREHPVQRLIFREIALQLKTFAGYARRIGKEDLAVILETHLRKIEELAREKFKTGIGTIDRDKIFDEIELNLASFTAPSTQQMFRR